MWSGVWSREKVLKGDFILNQFTHPFELHHLRQQRVLLFAHDKKPLYGKWRSTTLRCWEHYKRCCCQLKTIQWWRVGFKYYPKQGFLIFNWNILLQKYLYSWFYTIASLRRVFIFRHLIAIDWDREIDRKIVTMILLSNGNNHFKKWIEPLNW